MSGDDSGIERDDDKMMLRDRSHRSNQSDLDKEDPAVRLFYPAIPSSDMQLPDQDSTPLLPQWSVESDPMRQYEVVKSGGAWQLELSCRRCEIRSM